MNYIRIEALFNFKLKSVCLFGFNPSLASIYLLPEFRQTAANLFGMILQLGDQSRDLSKENKFKQGSSKHCSPWYLYITEKCARVE